MGSRALLRFQNTISCCYLSSGVSYNTPIGNLRTTTKFTTTASVDWEKTGTRTSVSAGKRKLNDDYTESKHKM